MGARRVRRRATVHRCWLMPPPRRRTGTRRCSRSRSPAPSARWPRLRLADGARSDCALRRARRCGHHARGACDLQGAWLVDRRCSPSGAAVGMRRSAGSTARMASARRCLRERSWVAPPVRRWGCRRATPQAPTATRHHCSAGRHDGHRAPRPAGACNARDGGHRSPPRPPSCRARPSCPNPASTLHEPRVPHPVRSSSRSGCSGLGWAPVDSCCWRRDASGDLNRAVVRPSPTASPRAGSLTSAWLATSPRRSST